MWKITLPLKKDSFWLGMNNVFKRIKTTIFMCKRVKSLSCILVRCALRQVYMKVSLIWWKERKHNYCADSSWWFNGKDITVK